MQAIHLKLEVSVLLKEEIRNRIILTNCCGSNKIPAIQQVINDTGRDPVKRSLKALSIVKDIRILEEGMLVTLGECKKRYK